MRNYLIIFFLLSSLVFSSCSSIKNSNYKNHSIVSPIKRENKTTLYKANIKVFGNFFSGLVLFKYNKPTNDFNVVLLTEMGLTLCEFYHKDNKMIIKKASSLFQSKMAQNVLLEDFSYLLQEINDVKRLSDTEFKSKEKVRYKINENNQPIYIRKRRLINGVLVDVDSYKTGVPALINFKHKGIKFNMKLSLLKVS